MRDPARIYPFLNKFAELWMTQPDLRFGQIVNNLQCKCGNDLFYIEDDRYLEKLEEMFKEKEELKKIFLDILKKI